MTFLTKVRNLLGNPYFGQSLYDRIAFSVFVFGAHFMLWYEIWIVMPYYNGHLSPFRFVHYGAAAVMYINALGNLYSMISARICLPEMDVNRHKEWRYCSQCMLYTPPRSHHCKICKVCILKRDHHCWFAGICVGWHNHRYFVAMVTWLWITAVYGNVYNFTFVTDILGSSFGTIICILVPHFAALLGYLSLSQFFIAILTMIGFLLLVLFTWMLQIQIVQIYNGQTKYERKNQIRDYDLGWKKNVTEVLGDRWFLVLLFPWVPSKLPGNGYEYQEDMKAL